MIECRVSLWDSRILSGYQGVNILCSDYFSGLLAEEYITLIYLGVTVNSSTIVIFFSWGGVGRELNPGVLYQATSPTLGKTGSHQVTQAELEIAIIPPQPSFSECWHYRHMPSQLASTAVLLLALSIKYMWYLSVSVSRKRSLLSILKGQSKSRSLHYWSRNV